jgi:hypothetical protein
MDASKLKDILYQHRLWIVTNGVQGERADLRFANLYRANLYGANLYRADLRFANLRFANLNGANLYRANLNVADLRFANLTDANLKDANLNVADLRGAYLRGAHLTGANLRGTIGLPDVSWIIPGCLVQLNQIKYDFFLRKESKYENFVQDSFGFIVQNNPEEDTFDMLLGDRIIRDIPHWVKYSGLKKL